MPHESVNDSIPLILDAKGRLVVDKCRRFNDSISDDEYVAAHGIEKWKTPPRKKNRTIIPCDQGWDYINATDGWFSLLMCHEIFKKREIGQQFNPNCAGESIVTEWDLVCGDSWINEFTTSMINVGQAVGGLMIQPLGDRFGRRKVIGKILIQ